LCAVAYHNHTELPRGETERCLFFTKLLRDADKFTEFDYTTHEDACSKQLKLFEL